jgi:hypothetical protein
MEEMKVVLKVHWKAARTAASSVAHLVLQKVDLLEHM